MTVQLTLQNACNTNSIPSQQQFETWAKTALQHIDDSPKNCELVIRLVDETESATLNKTYRNKQGATNVLSFHYEMTGDDEHCELGDLAICAKLVEKEAAEQQKPLEAHWAHLTIHGILHLLGFDHENEQDATTMEALERNIMQTLHYDDPYNDSE